MKRNAESSARDEGAILVEFALVLPVLLLLFVGIVQFGLLFNAQIALQGAAREGARELALGNDGAVVGVVQDALGRDDLDVEVAPAGCGGNAERATVRASIDYSFELPFFPISLELDAKASMRCGL